MKTLYIFTALIILEACSLKISAQVNASWISTGLFPEANSSTATVVKADQSGNILAAGSIYNINSPYEYIYIVKYDKQEGGHLVMDDESIVPVSSRKKDELFKHFEKM